MSASAAAISGAPAARTTSRAQRATQIEHVCAHHESLYCPLAADQADTDRKP